MAKMVWLARMSLELTQTWRQSKRLDMFFSIRNALTSFHCGSRWHVIGHMQN
jgi:hypothetical protein